MYRPYFGNRDVFEDDVVGNVMDRGAPAGAGQAGLGDSQRPSANHRGRLDRVEVDFLPGETLDEWRLWVLRALDGGFSWERLRFMARRISGGDEDHPAHRLADDFIRSMPGSLERLYESAPGASLAKLKERTVARLVRVVGSTCSEGGHRRFRGPVPPPGEQGHRPRQGSPGSLGRDNEALGASFTTPAQAVEWILRRVRRAATMRSGS